MTPAAAQPAQGSTIFAAQAATLRQNPQPPPASTPAQTANAQSKSPIERAAQTINATFTVEERFPAMEDYVQQGISGEYEHPKLGSALEPFQKLKLHDLPPRLLEQANHGHMAMQMGVFAPLGHAWVALDNCLYLWDYTLPNPDILGFEENNHPITAVKLVAPRPGVFIEDIKHMIVVCTDSEMLLLGVALQNTPTGAREVHLYNTRMTISIKGLGVHLVEASSNGRIIFCGNYSDDIFEFHYQQEEGWFRGKTQRVCHTKSNMSYVSETMRGTISFFGSKEPNKFFTRMAIDDSRSLLYTLTNSGEIKVWLMKDNGLDSGISRPFHALLQNTGHFNSRTELLTGREVKLIAISVLPASETRKLSLMATTNTGCRLYLSVTRGYGYQADAQNPPSSMQILHIRYPPRDPAAPPAPHQGQTMALAPLSQSTNQVETTSTFLSSTNMAYRFSPGYFMAFQPDPKDKENKERVFLVAPDSARLKSPQGTSQVNNYVEYGQWVDLPSGLFQVQELTDPFSAGQDPTGFGNELAVQFDKPASEFALVTSSGIQTIRRKRLVDVFAAMMRYGSSSDEGLEGDVKRFVRTYGRAETCATALAVACGKGIDIADNRVASISDPDVLEKARKVFIEHGGSPDFNTNSVVDGGANLVESVTPSPRHDGIALYISRLIRSIWRSKIITDNLKPGTKYLPTIGIDKLREIQRDLTTLREFLDRNRSFIEGLSGAQALSRAKTRGEEVALQGEHQYMTSLVKLLETISEGISFVIVLFDEPVEGILALLPSESVGKTLDLTFEALFVSPSGHDLGKDLVRAIVNRHIANGSNVDTVAETLRRRCGSFCSADDVVIFKAQEQVKRATEAGAQSDSARQLLNESQRLFQKCASNLPFEYLKQAVHDYIRMAFYAGAIQLCLVVANEKDKSKRAFAWLRDGKPAGSDKREEAYDVRLQSYTLVKDVIKALEADTESAPAQVDGKYTLVTKRLNEAYDVINGSDDIVFLTDLYDWYVGDLNQPDRLLNIDNPYVVDYLRKRSQDHRLHNDLLWRYYVHHNDFLQAASVQLALARSCFDELSLSDRIGYLSRAHTNAETRTSIITDSRQSKQRLLREVDDLIEIAKVQQDLLERLLNDSRIDPEQKKTIEHELGSEVQPVELLFNKYADVAKYHDICIILYKVADHRNPGDIRASWDSLIKDTSSEAIALYGHAMKPWEAVGEAVRRLGRQLALNPATFPINTLLPLLEAYAYEPRAQRPPETWALDIMLDLEIPCETLLPVLESMFYSNIQPFTGSRKKKLAEKMVYVVRRWFEDSERSGERVLFGSEENASMVQDCLASLGRDSSLGQEVRDVAAAMSQQIAHALR
jgi:nuclear pore complex protein Nup155